jgi:hypothetical protein
VALWTAEDLIRRHVPWPCELTDGVPRRIPRSAGRAREAARLARLLATLVRADDAWASSEALIRLRRAPDTAWRPDAAVITGPLPATGVVDGVPLVVVEAGLERARRWRTVGCPAWVPGHDGVLVVEAAGERTIGVDGRLRLPPPLEAAVAARLVCGAAEAIR